MSGITYYHNYTYLESEPDKKIEELKKSLDEKEQKLKIVLAETEQRIQQLEAQVSGMTPVVDGLVNIPIGHNIKDDTSYIYVDKFTTLIEAEKIKDACIDVSSFGLLKKLETFDLHDITNVCLFLSETITSKMNPFILLDDNTIEGALRHTYNTAPLFKTFIDTMIKNGTTIYWKSQALNGLFVETEDTSKSESKEICSTSPEIIPDVVFSKCKEPVTQSPQPQQKVFLKPQQYKPLDGIHKYEIERIESVPSRTVPEKPIEPPAKYALRSDKPLSSAVLSPFK